jgi:beta-lactamase superfamily II metal-dependent hydrolase
MSVNANIRMYNQLDLGDCFLLKFTSEEEESFMLIDFGSYKSGNAEREKEIATNIMETIGDKKLTIVLTHQHKDHLSGFATAGDILKGKERELWLSFLDSDTSTEGVFIRSMTEKYWNKNTKIKKILTEKFTGVPQVDAMMKEKEGYDLFAEGQTGGESMTKLLEIVNKNVTFLTPGQSFPLPGISSGIKVYVLGPPIKNEQLAKLNPTKDEAVHGLSVLDFANMDISGDLMLDAIDSYGQNESSRQSDFPFSHQFKQQDQENDQKKSYEDPKNSWRTINYDWLSEIGRLSLHMDRLTNNTSLVLAFEFTESKKVLLFVGDAQIGNWQSWFDVKFDNGLTGKDLLSRTVFYKAGHHSSHNATLRQGLDLMSDKELTIMIPVNEEVSSNFHFAMLKPEMLKGYHRKSKGRVLRADTIEQDGSKFQLDFPFVTRNHMINELTIFPDDGTPHLWMELKIDEK